MLTQVRSWQFDHVEDTKQHMRDAMRTWRAARQDYQHALSLLDPAIYAARNGLPVDAEDLRRDAERLRSCIARMTPLEHLQGDPLQATITACNEAIGRINENHAVMAGHMYWLDRMADDPPTRATRQPVTPPRSGSTDESHRGNRACSPNPTSRPIQRLQPVHLLLVDC